MPERKTLVLLKERVLLENSEILHQISGEYPWLIRFLQENPKAKISGLGSFDEEIQNFFRHRYKQIIMQAASEWASHKGRPLDVKDKEEMCECELCHQKPIRFVFSIMNKLNGKELNVGGECVKHFGMELGKDVRQLIKEMKELQRINRLEKAIPGIKKTIDSWERELESFPVMIPLSLENPYLDLGERAKRLYRDFLAQDLLPDQVERNVTEFQKILEQKRKCLKVIQDYAEKNRDAQFIPGKEILRWVKTTGKSEDPQLLRWLKEDGRITWRTAFRIGEPNYLKSLIPLFNEYLQNTGSFIEKLSNDRGSDGYIIYVPSQQIRIFTKCRGFLMEFGGLLFGEPIDKPLDLKNIMLNGTVYGENSVNIILDNLKNQAMEFGYGIYRHEYEYNELIFQHQGTGLYVIESLKPFVEKFKLLALGLDDGGKEELQNHFKALDGKKKISKEDLNYLLGQR